MERKKILCMVAVALVIVLVGCNSDDKPDAVVPEECTIEGILSYQDEGWQVEVTAGRPDTVYLVKSYSIKIPKTCRAKVSVRGRRTLCKTGRESANRVVYELTVKSLEAVREECSIVGRLQWGGESGKFSSVPTTVSIRSITSIRIIPSSGTKAICWFRRRV